MWEQIGAGAVYSAIGGGSGAAIGALMAMFFRNTRFARYAATILTVVGAVAGANLAEPLLKQHIGEYLPQSTNTFDEQFDVVIAELEAYPLMAAIMEREPQLKSDMKAQLSDVTKTATNNVAAQVQSFSVAYNLVLGRVVSYFARGTDEDLITMITTTVEILDDLAARDPAFCFDYLYAPQALARRPPDYVRTKIGADIFDRQQEELATLVLNAYDVVPDYDRDAAQAGLNAASEVLSADMGEKLGLVAGQLLPEGEEDAKLACAATANMYRYILTRPDAALTGRHIFSLST